MQLRFRSSQHLVFMDVQPLLDRRLLGFMTPLNNRVYPSGPGAFLSNAECGAATQTELFHPGMATDGGDGHR